MGLLQDQDFLSKQQPMPVDDVSISSSVQTITGETVSLYYSNSGTRTIDAGQAAGTAVMGQLANKNILDVNGSSIATKLDYSLSFTGNCFTTQVAFPYLQYKDIKDKTWAGKLSAITANFANGEYCIDYASGAIYGKKATTTSSLTSVSYKIPSTPRGVGSSDSTTPRVTIATTSMLAQGTETTATNDNYTTIITPSSECSHLYWYLQGSNDAIISLDAGTTNNFTIIAGTSGVFDNLKISSGVAIQAKNKTAGSNFSKLNISVW